MLPGMELQFWQLATLRTLFCDRPMPGGGWGGTHEDMTEREQLAKERDEMAARENRRAIIERQLRLSASA
jgi:hypothetical protein